MPDRSQMSGHTRNPYQAPAPQLEGPEALPLQALKHSWVTSVRTFLVLTFIVFGGSIFHSALFAAPFSFGQATAGLGIVTLLICPPTFVATYLDLRRQRFPPD